MADDSLVENLIEVLSKRPQGLLRPAILREMEKKRKLAGLPIPENFEQSVQSSYQRHSVDSEVYRKRKAPESDGLFFSQGGKGTGIWAVNSDRATAWLEKRQNDPVKREERVIAKRLVLEALRKDGHKIADVDVSEINRLVEETIAKNEKITIMAKRRVEERATLGTDDLDEEDLP